MFTNLGLVLLLLLTGSLVPNFHSKSTEKAREKSGTWSDVVQFGRFGETKPSLLQEAFLTLINSKTRMRM